MDIMKRFCFLQTLFIPLQANLLLLKIRVSVTTVVCATLQTDHHAIGQLSAGKAKQSLAVEAKGAQACEECSAAQRVVADFRQRLEVVEAAQAGRDSKQAHSMPSTQDHSGDTNDDRYGSANSAAVTRSR